MTQIATTEEKPLAHMAWHKALVIGIQPKQDVFQNKTTGKYNYCHFIDLLTVVEEDKTRPIRIQVCNESETFDLFRVNDDIEYMTSKWSPKALRYTMSNFRMCRSADDKLAATRKANKAYAGFEGEEGIKAEAVEEVKEFFRPQSPVLHQEIAKDPSSSVLSKGEQRQLMIQVMNAASLLIQMKGNITEEEYFRWVDKMYEKVTSI